MRSKWLWTILVALASDVAGLAVLRADDGTITLKIHEAIAAKKDNDDLFGPQQDFFVCSDIDHQGALISAAEIGNHDHASWNPPGTNFKLVPGKNQRFFDIYLELWDNDDTSDDEDFDISPQNGPPPPSPLHACSYENTPTGGFPHITYDVCTGKMYVNGVNGSSIIPIGSNAAEANGANTSNGTIGNWAALRFEVVRQPSDWLPDDVSIEKVEIVQSVYGAMEAVVDKDTALIVRIASTYPNPINAPVTGTITDGITTAVDTRVVSINPGTPSQPGETLVSLFDGTTAPRFKPQKSVLIGTGKVSGSASINYPEVVSPNAPIQLRDCADVNNTGAATDLPLKRTTDLKTVFAPFDYQEDLNFVTSQQLQAMHTREETYRLASWPLASLDSSMSFNQLFLDHGATAPFFEPFTSVMIESFGAMISGIDRQVLAVRKGWFADNQFRHQFIGAGSVGYSLGWFAPHAVLAEDGFFGTATHELGHTYNLSQHNCSVGNFDEYAMLASCGAPFEADGFDVSGNVYPNGFHSTQAGLACPAGPVQSRDVCAANLMDSTASDKYRNWIDTFTYHYLLDNALPHTDPPVVAIAGMIYLPNGMGDGTSAPVVQGSMPLFSYQFMGNQDVPMAPLSPMGEAFEGIGPYRVRFVTPAGVRDYRFYPRFFTNNGTPDLLGGFSLNFPWDPATTAIRLIGPSDARDESCWNRLCPGDGVILDQRVVSLLPPAVANLRAGRDAAAPPPVAGSGSTPPTIGPGHDAVVSWDASDPDSPALRATLVLSRQDAAGGTSGTPAPVAIDLSGSSFRIPQAGLAHDPGLYTGRLLVSDGINTTEMSNGALFNVCNLSNGGLEICNGIDDDCDGTIDNGQAPGPVSVTLNPQPFPPEPSGLMSWTPSPLAQSYDVVYGSVESLRNSHGDFSVATLGCLAENTTSASASTGPVPPVGQAYFYLVRGNNCIGPGTYDSGYASQVAPRDASINAARSSCRP